MSTSILTFSSPSDTSLATNSGFTYQRIGIIRPFYSHQTEEVIQDHGIPQTASLPILIDALSEDMLSLRNLDSELMKRLWMDWRVALVASIDRIAWQLADICMVGIESFSL